MAGKRGRIAELAVALLLLSIGLNVHSKDVRVLSFSFEVPDTWEVDGKGGDKLFATGATQMYAPPWVLAEGCVPSAKGDCSRFQRPDPAKEMQQGCADVIGERVPRDDGLLETRWVCSPFTVDGIKVALGTILFEGNGTILMVAYAGREEDTPVPAFLERIARSLKVGWLGERRLRCGAARLLQRATTRTLGGKAMHRALHWSEDA